MIFLLKKYGQVPVGEHLTVVIPVNPLLTGHIYLDRNTDDKGAFNDLMLGVIYRIVTMSDNQILSYFAESVTIDDSLPFNVDRDAENCDYLFKQIAEFKPSQDCNDFINHFRVLRTVENNSSQSDAASGGSIQTQTSFTKSIATIMGEYRTKLWSKDNIIISNSNTSGGYSSLSTENTPLVVHYPLVVH